MSESMVVDSPSELSERTIPLLKEYLAKLRRLRRELRGLNDEYKGLSSDPFRQDAVATEYTQLQHGFNRLRPAIQQFVQQVSGIVDQGKVSPLTRAELRLRLAELESMLVQMPSLIQAYQPH